MYTLLGSERGLDRTIEGLKRYLQGIFIYIYRYVSVWSAIEQRLGVKCEMTIFDIPCWFILPTMLHNCYCMLAQGSQPVGKTTGKDS